MRRYKAVTRGISLLAVLAAVGFVWYTTTATSRPSPGNDANVPTVTSPADAAGLVGPDGAFMPSAFVGALTTAPELPRQGYKRELFPHWLDDDNNGCNTRYEVLASQSLVPTDCRRINGSWRSYLDGYTTTDHRELDVDHTVALAEAWDSGARDWEPARRQAFANDMATPGALRAVTASENRRKSDLDPADYQPASSAAWCQFATDWMWVKYRWSLTVDAREAQALTTMTRDCPRMRPGA
jgi:hypothetical protein